jgi:hypothetical protein
MENEFSFIKGKFIQFLSQLLLIQDLRKHFSEK